MDICRRKEEWGGIDGTYSLYDMHAVDCHAGWIKDCAWQGHREDRRDAVVLADACCGIWQLAF